MIRLYPNQRLDEFNQRQKFDGRKNGKNFNKLYAKTNTMSWIAYGNYLYTYNPADESNNRQRTEIKQSPLSVNQKLTIIFSGIAIGLAVFIAFYFAIKCFGNKQVMPYNQVKLHLLNFTIYCLDYEQCDFQ